MMMEAMTTPGGNDETYGDMDGGWKIPFSHQTSHGGWIFFSCGTLPETNIHSP